jgi:hypothetical protein
MSFEPAGPASKITAILRDREITDGNFVLGSEPKIKHGGTWLYRSVRAKTNYQLKQGDDSASPKWVFSYTNMSGRAASYKGEVLEIDDVLLQLHDNDKPIHASIITAIVKNLEVTPSIVQCRLLPSALAACEVGSSIIVTSAFVDDIHSGARSILQKPGIVTECSPEWGKENFEIAVTVRLTPLEAQGWSPAMKIRAANQYSLVGTTLTLRSMETDPTNNVYGNPIGGLTELSYFGCFGYDSSLGEVTERDCDCSSYAVRLFDEGAAAYATTGAGRNVWTGVIKGSTTDRLTLDDIAAGAARIILDDATNFSTSTTKIVRFRERSHSGLQDCQTIYGWLGDNTGFASDSAGERYRAFTWS